MHYDENHDALRSALLAAVQRDWRRFAPRILATMPHTRMVAEKAPAGKIADEQVTVGATTPELLEVEAQGIEAQGIEAIQIVGPAEITIVNAPYQSQSMPSGSYAERIRSAFEGVHESSVHREQLGSFAEHVGASQIDALPLPEPHFVENALPSLDSSTPLTHSLSFAEPHDGGETSLHELLPHEGSASWDDGATEVVVDDTTALGQLNSNETETPDPFRQMDDPFSSVSTASTASTATIGSTGSVDMVDLDCDQAEPKTSELGPCLVEPRDSCVVEMPLESIETTDENSDQDALCSSELSIPSSAYASPENRVEFENQLVPLDADSDDFRDLVDSDEDLMPNRLEIDALWDALSRPTASEYAVITDSGAALNSQPLQNEQTHQKNPTTEVNAMAPANEASAATISQTSTAATDEQERVDGQTESAQADTNISRSLLDSASFDESRTLDDVLDTLEFVMVADDSAEDRAEHPALAESAILVQDLAQTDPHQENDSLPEIDSLREIESPTEAHTEKESTVGCEDDDEDFEDSTTNDLDELAQPAISAIRNPIPRPYEEARPRFSGLALALRKAREMTGQMPSLNFRQIEAPKNSSFSSVEVLDRENSNVEEQADPVRPTQDIPVQDIPVQDAARQPDPEETLLDQEVRAEEIPASQDKIEKNESPERAVPEAEVPDWALPQDSFSESALPANEMPEVALPESALSASTEPDIAEIESAESEHLVSESAPKDFSTALFGDDDAPVDQADHVLPSSDLHSPLAEATIPAPIEDSIVPNAETDIQNPEPYGPESHELAFDQSVVDSKDSEDQDLALPSHPEEHVAHDGSNMIGDDFAAIDHFDAPNSAPFDPHGSPEETVIETQSLSTSAAELIEASPIPVQASAFLTDLTPVNNDPVIDETEVIERESLIPHSRSDDSIGIPNSHTQVPTLTVVEGEAKTLDPNEFEPLEPALAEYEATEHVELEEHSDADPFEDEFAPVNPGIGEPFNPLHDGVAPVERFAIFSFFVPPPKSGSSTDAAEDRRNAG